MPKLLEYHNQNGAQDVHEAKALHVVEKGEITHREHIRPDDLP